MGYDQVNIPHALILWAYSQLVSNSFSSEIGGGEKLFSANIDEIMSMYYFTAAFQNRMNKVVANCVAKANAPRQSHIMWLP